MPTTTTTLDLEDEFAECSIDLGFFQRWAREAETSRERCMLYDIADSTNDPRMFKILSDAWGYKWWNTPAGLGKPQTTIEEF